MLHFLSALLAATWAQLQPVAVILAIGLLIERLRPAERGQPPSHFAFNLVWTVLYAFAINLLVPPLAALTKPLIDAYGLRLPLHFPDNPGGQIVQAICLLAIYDFFYYWLHRAQHVFPVLWAEHRIHHSDVSLNVTTNNRHHWLEEPIRVFAVLLPMGLLFDQKPVTIAWLWLAMTAWAYFIHMNLRLPLGPLTAVIAGPQLHRIHHSVDRAHRDRNFAAFFPIYDVLFGTYYRPHPGEYPVTGLDTGENLNGLWRASVAPFGTWFAMLRSQRKKPLA